MKIPETLYNEFKTTRSGLLPAFEVFKKGFSVASVSVVGDLYVVPDEYMLILSNLAVELVAGTTQNTLECHVNIYPSKGIAALLTAVRFLGTRANEFQMWSGEVYLESGSKIEITGIFAGSTNNNQVLGSIFGMLIPELTV